MYIYTYIPATVELCRPSIAVAVVVRSGVKSAGGGGGSGGAGSNLVVDYETSSAAVASTAPRRAEPRGGNRDPVRVRRPPRYHVRVQSETVHHVVYAVAASSHFRIRSRDRRSPKVRSQCALIDFLPSRTSTCRCRVLAFT